MWVFKEFGIPCWHIYAAALSIRMNPKALIVPERSLGALKMMYTGWVVPVDLNDLDEDGLKTPSKTKKRGRPKEKGWCLQPKKVGRGL